MMKKQIITCISLAFLTLACIKQRVETWDELPTPVEHIQPSNLVDFPVDPGSFVGLHKYIFSTTCAVSGCHDGSFEPDFRTVQSAYNTLVNHKIIKNTNDNRFEYRVIPGDVANSMLYERLTTTDQVLGRMPLYDYPLTTSQLKLIENWINAGAPDGFGNSPTNYDDEPETYGFLAYLNTDNDSLDDELIPRGPTLTDPYEFPKDTVIKLWFEVHDLDDEGKPVFGKQTTFNKIRFSDKYYDFSGQPYQQMTQGVDIDFLYAELHVDPNVMVRYFHYFSFSTKDYEVGDVIYMRIYVQDKDHSYPTELPDSNSPLALNAYFSFKIVP